MEKEESFLKSLPKIETSFQDDFCGCESELYLTTGYVLRMFGEARITPRIGDKILFWEKDTDKDDNLEYICAVGEIMEATDENVKDYVYDGRKIDFDRVSRLGEKPVVVKLIPNNTSWFRLPPSSPVFQDLVSK